ncbi:hypothetical protein K8I31_02840 [bacterium]|nr:hypothetical protein [bacterium]
MRISKLFLLCILVAVHAVNAVPLPIGVSFYVSPLGLDSNEGTEAKPFATLERAQQAVRKEIGKGLSESICVYLDGGVYTLSEPLRFGPQDSGSETCAVYWRAKPGARVLISGGRELNDWTSSGGSKWTCKVPGAREGKWWFRQLFADGERLVRARYPTEKILSFALKNWMTRCVPSKWTLQFLAVSAKPTARKWSSSKTGRSRGRTLRRLKNKT